MRQRTTFTVSLRHLKGFVITVKLIEKIAKNGCFFGPKFAVGKEFLTNPEFWPKKQPLFAILSTSLTVAIKPLTWRKETVDVVL